MARHRLMVSGQVIEFTWAPDREGGGTCQCPGVLTFYASSLDLCKEILISLFHRKAMQ